MKFVFCMTLTGNANCGTAKTHQSSGRCAFCHFPLRPRLLFIFCNDGAVNTDRNDVFKRSLVEQPLFDRVKFQSMPVAIIYRFVFGPSRCLFSLLSLMLRNILMVFNFLNAQLVENFHFFFSQAPSGSPSLKGVLGIVRQVHLLIFVG